MIDFEQIRQGYPQLMSWKPQDKEVAIVDVVSDNGIQLETTLRHIGAIEGKRYVHVANVVEVIEERQARGQHKSAKVFQRLKVVGELTLFN